MAHLENNVCLFLYRIFSYILKYKHLNTSFRTNPTISPYWKKCVVMNNIMIFMQFFITNITLIIFTIFPFIAKSFMFLFFYFELIHIFCNIAISIHFLEQTSK